MSDARYLITSHIPLYSRNGRFFAEDLWHRDLHGHLAHLRHLTLACPVLDLTTNSGAANLRPVDSATLSVIEVPHARSARQACMLLHRTVQRLWHAVGTADIVHTHIVGGPIPMAWIVIPMCLLRRRFSVINVESSPWCGEGLRVGIRRRLRNYLGERLARACIAYCDLPLYTHAGYQRRLSKSLRGHIVSASWISGEWVLSQNEARHVWREKLPPAGPIRLLFVGRLIEEKGIRFLLNVMDELDQANAQVSLDILGAGPLKRLCQQAATRRRGTVKINYLGTVPYDEHFRFLLRKYHCLVIPTISDEQPRIIYDGFAQAVPCVAADTDGNRQIVKHGDNGLLLPFGDVVKWARSIGSLGKLPLDQMGLHSLEAARDFTHERMHALRAMLVGRAFKEWQCRP